FLTTYRARREYPNLNEDESKTQSKDDLDGLNRNVRAILLHKIGNTLINNIDNLVITSMAGFRMVGIYSIYYLIIGSIRQVLERGIHGIAGSLGNLGVSDDKEKVYPVFELVLFITVFLFGYFAIAIFEIINLFVELSFGKLYVFSSVIVAVLCLNFFLNGVRQATLTFRDSLGLFYKDRYKTIVESLINLFFSIVLTRYYGIIGVFIATSISIVTVSMWIEPLILYKDYFGLSVWLYFRKLFIYCLGLGLCLAVSHYLCALLSINYILNILYRGIVCTVVCFSLFYLLFRKTKEMDYLLKKIIPVLKRGRKI
ncbi:MAG: hypothetical protein J6S38_06205, partial [Erysipelotrichaceae bacterium]|nr:hypothetical protein [Erysipelotrichaceae bacterium]